MKGVPLAEVVEYLDDYLRIGEVPDESTAVNGLQVENGGMVGSLVAAVDASQASIDGVVDGARSAEGIAPPLLLVHHGLFWDGNRPVTGRRYRRLNALLSADVAVYSAHIPLDLHPDVGNNVVLAERLGLEVEGRFGDYRGIDLGVWGHVPHGLENREALAVELGRVLGTGPAKLIPGGPERASRIGIITGGAASMLKDAQAAGLDTFVTGEGAHHTYFDAMEADINLLLGGHYATESLGVQALASHLADHFDLPWEFHDHPTGL